MTYASGGLIQAADYNGFVATLNNIWHTGSGNYGYGQSLPLSNVTAANTSFPVTPNQWNSLFARMNVISQHQTNATTGLGTVATGDVITYISSLTGLISTLDTNRLNAFTQGANSNVIVSNTTVWTSQSVKEVSVTFANINAMRYFFNCGGAIQFTAKDSTLSGNAKSLDWDTLLAASGIAKITGKDSGKVTGSGSGTPSVNNTFLPFYSLTTSYQKIVEQYSTTAAGGYLSNFATFEAKLNASPGLSTVLTLKITLTDNSPDETLPTNSNNVLGNVITQFTALYPETTYLANTWGAVTFTTLTNSQL